MAGFYIVTNNDSVVTLFKQYQAVPNSPEIKYVEAAASRVLQMAREAVHKGSQLLNHPLAGNIPPGENPFKTLFITIAEEDCVVLHFQSVSLIEESLRAYNKAGKNRFRAYSDDKLKEYKAADMELTMAVIQSLAQSVKNLQ